jgi:beta-ribofuranosylaminobenzene 5'-phosphate synthase
MVRVSAGARLHFGFQNLSLAHERLYGGVGVALAEPRVTVAARTAARVDCDDDLAREYATRACNRLDAPGAAVTVEERLPRHVGLGSGTQLALAVLAAVARAHDRDPRVRERAPALGRGGRSGVGVAAFEDGGFVVDAGHPTEQFTTDRPADGEWAVPPVVARHALPDDWRFVLALPEAPDGRSGDDEDASMRTVVENADPGVADEVAGVVTRRLLPAATVGRLDAFGDALTEFGRLNGIWYTEEQGGVYRPPAGDLVERLRGDPAIAGVGQSSWGPAVYALTDDRRADDAHRAAERALEAVGGGELVVSAPDDAGAQVE